MHLLRKGAAGPPQDRHRLQSWHLLRHLSRPAAGHPLRGPVASSGIVVAAGVIMMALFAQRYIGSVFVLALSYAIVTAGMAVQIGFSQQVAFSQSVFMGFGAYGVALLNTKLGLPTLPAVLAVTLGSGVVAGLLGMVVSRAAGLALPVATIMFPLIATGYLSSAGYLGGSVGMPLTDSLWPGGSPGAIAVGNGLITVAIVGVVIFVATRVLASDLGLELYVLGVDEGVAAAMGVSTPRRKLELFVLGSMFASLGGAVYAGTQLFVPATLVGATAELSLLMMLFVGGRRSILGAVVGALAIEYVSGASNFVSVNLLIVQGVLITVVLLVEPEGLAGIGRSLLRAARTHVAPPTPAPPAPAPPTSTAPSPAPPTREPADDEEGALRSGWAARAEVTESESLLECAGIAKDYGGLRVLDAVSLTIPARGIFGLCGPNGAGKSTLLNVIGGSVGPSAGRVLLEGQDVTRLRPPARFRLGVSRTFQAVHLIPGRSVLDNVAVACLESHRSNLAAGIVRNRLDEARDKAMEALDFLGMREVRGLDVAALTLENQRMVELARAIAAKPRLLLLDEPASGLSASQRERLKEVLSAVGELTCVFLVEHDLDLVASIAEKIFVLSSGRLVFDGDPAGFRSSEVVTSLLIGL
jgi:branched-chain amino acid transport system permease protein